MMISFSDTESSILDDKTQLHQIDQLRRNGQFEKALTQCQRLFETLNSLDKSKELSSQPPIRLNCQALLALLYVTQRDSDNAQTLLTSLLSQLSPKDERHAMAWRDAGGAQLLLSQPVIALQSLKIARSLAPDDPIIHARIALIYANQGKIQQALTAQYKAVELDPNDAEMNTNLAKLLSSNGQLEEAKHYIDRANAIDSVPCNEEMSLSQLYVQLMFGNGQKMYVGLTRSLTDNPNSVHLLRLCATTAHHLHYLEEAEKYLIRANQLEPDHLEVIQDLAQLLYVSQKNPLLIKVLRKAIKLHPDRLSLQIELATVLIDDVQFIAAKKQFDHVFAKIKNRHEESDHLTEIYRGYGFLQMLDGHHDQAERWYKLAQAHSPNSLTVLADLAHLYLEMGRFDDGEIIYDQIAELNPQSGLMMKINHSRTPTLDERSLTVFGNMIMRPSMQTTFKISQMFALARAYEKRGEYHKGFPWALQANALLDDVIDYDPIQNSYSTDQLIKTFDARFFEQRRDVGVSSRLPIFVVGMPRSGTTLVEQILDSHPDVHGAGELNYLAMHVTQLMYEWPLARTNNMEFPRSCGLLTPPQITALAVYHQSLLRVHHPTAKRIVDKLPHNFRYVGFIRLMFPNATIINCTREPRDIAVSSFMINFRHRQGALGYACNLENTGRAIVDYQRLMRHWHQVFPGWILDVPYEEMVSDPENMTRKILAHCGLSWDPAVMDFHTNKRTVRTASLAQVRKPIYQTSKARWRNYEPFLGPLEKGLNYA